MEFEVYAIAIDDTHIYYKCPFDVRLIHTHGSNEDLLNRVEFRSGHQSGDCKCGNMKINIGDYTKRITLEKG